MPSFHAAHTICAQLLLEQVPPGSTVSGDTALLPLPSLLIWEDISPLTHEKVVLLFSHPASMFFPPPVHLQLAQAVPFRSPGGSL